MKSAILGTQRHGIDVARGPTHVETKWGGCAVCRRRRRGTKRMDVQQKVALVGKFLETATLFLGKAGGRCAPEKRRDGSRVAAARPWASVHVVAFPEEGWRAEEVLE